MSKTRNSVAPKFSNNALDYIFLSLLPFGRVNVADSGLIETLTVNLTNPSSDREASLFHISRTSELDYAIAYAKSQLIEVLEDDYVEVGEIDNLEELLALVSKNQTTLLHNTGFISLCQLLFVTQQKMKNFVLCETLPELQSELQAGNLDPEQFLFLLLRIMMSQDIDQDELQIVVSAFCLNLFNSNGDRPFGIEKSKSAGKSNKIIFISRTLQYFSGAELEDIIDIVTPRIEYAFANFQRFRQQYEGLDYVAVIENLFTGLPLPSFIRHHGARKVSDYFRTEIDLKCTSETWKA